MNRKSLYKVLSLILAVILALPILPARTIKAEDTNPESDVSTVSPAAITVMGVEDTNTTLNIMDGPITVTDQNYVQKDSSGNVIGEGEVIGELVLTGTQGNGWNLTVNGSNLPVIHFINVSTNGYITGTAAGALNIIIEGNCTFSNKLAYNLTNLTNLNITGIEGNSVNGSVSGSDGVSIYEVNKLESLNINGLNVNTYSWRVSVPKSLYLFDCIVNSKAILDSSYYDNLANYSSQTTIENSIFNSDFTLRSKTNVEIVNTTISDNQGIGDIIVGQGPSTAIIQDSNINSKGFILQAAANKIINSRLNAIGTVSAGSIRSGFISEYTVLVQGSTLITSASATYDYYMKYSTNIIVSDDSSFNFQGTPGSTKRFYRSGRINPIDLENHDLFLNKIKVPGASNSIVSVSIDGRDPVNLWTDTDGYLHLYLPTGEHTVHVTDTDGIEYSKTFTAIETQESTTNSNIIGELDPVKEATDIATPYLNSAIQYSFGNSDWNNATTDAAGYFKAVIPDNATRIYIKLISTGEVKHAVISDGEVGEFYDDNPIITEQSNPDLTFIKGMPGTMYVTAVPYTEGNTLTYQWYKNGEILTGKTSPVLNLSSMKVSDAGTYTCVITESDGRTVTSISIIVTIDESQPEEEGELKIISQSSGKTLIKGYSTELYVNARPSLSTRELTYQWYKNGEVIPDASDSKLLLNSVVLEDSGSYLCRVYEDSGYIDSVPILVIVENNPLEDDMTDLNNLVLELASQVGTLTDQLNTVNQEKDALQDTINGLESQIETYTNLITELQGHITDLEQELQDAEGDNETLNQTIIELNNQIAALNQQIASLQLDLEVANEDKTILEGTVTDLSNDIINLNLQITILEGRLADSEEENTQLANQVTELHNTISFLETEITNLQNDINSLTEQNNHLKSQVEALNGQKTALENEIQRLQGLLDEANETIDDLTRQVNDLTTEVNTLTGQLSAANEEKATLQITINGLEGQITVLNNQIIELNNHISELEEALQQEGADKETLNQTIIELNVQITTLNHTVSSLQIQLDTVTEERNSLQITVTELNNQITTLNEQIIILNGRLADSEEENAVLVGRVTELQNIISGFESDITNLQSDLEVLYNRNITLQGQLDSANNTITSLNALLALIKGELGVVKDDEIIPAIRQLKAQLQQEIANNSLLQDQLDQLNAELITVRNNNSVLIQKLQELMDLVGSEDEDGIKDKILELQTALSESEARVIKLEKEKNELITSLQEAENLNRSLQQRIDELLKLSDGDVVELKKQILDLTDQINQMIQINQELQESIHNLNIQVTELTTEKTALESEIVRLETLLETANSTIEELRKQLADMAAGKVNLENENAALKVEIENLKKQLESRNNSGSGNSGNSNNTTEVKELKDKLDQALTDLENAKKELEKLQENTGEENAGETDGTDSGNTGDLEIKIPENSVVVLPVEKAEVPVIKTPADKTIKDKKIVAEDGWEIAPTLESEWTKEIDLVETVGQGNKKEQVNYSFYAREEEKPKQVYTQTVNVEKPVAIPDFTMDKLIYLGSEFNLNIANISKNAKVSYKSADSSIAKINQTGTITPVKLGKTKITGTVTKDGIPYQFTVNVTVKGGEKRTLNLKDQAIQTSSDNPVLMVYKLVNKDKTTKINLKGYANNAAVSYITSDSSIATVNKYGVIKGIKKGNTTITATLAQNDTIYTYIIKVRVDDGTEDNTMWNYLTAS